MSKKIWKPIVCKNCGAKDVRWHNVNRKLCYQCEADRLWQILQNQQHKPSELSPVFVTEKDPIRREVRQGPGVTVDY